MTDKQYEIITKKIGNEIINYKTKTKSLTQIFNLLLTKYLNNPTLEQKNIILKNTIHYITVLGYDIENVKPCKFKKFNN